MNKITGCGIEVIPDLWPPRGAAWLPVPGFPSCHVATWGFIHNDGRRESYFALTGERGLGCVPDPDRKAVL